MSVTGSKNDDSGKVKTLIDSTIRARQIPFAMRMERGRVEEVRRLQRSARPEAPASAPSVYLHNK